MREFHIEVPVTVRVTVLAEDHETAARLARTVADRIEPRERLERVGGIWQLVTPEVVVGASAEQVSR